MTNGELDRGHYLKSWFSHNYPNSGPSIYVSSWVISQKNIEGSFIHIFGETKGLRYIIFSRKEKVADTAYFRKERNSMKTSLFGFLLLAPLSIVAHQNDEVSEAKSDVRPCFLLFNCVVGSPV